MQYSKIIFCLLTLIITVDIYAQDMKEYQWKNRIIILKSGEAQNELFKAQLADLQSDPLGLVERKLVVFQLQDQSYRKGLMQIGEWQKVDNRKLLTIANEDMSKFEVILIGLDGGVKLQRSTILPKDELFAIIDGMPMRRSEIRNKRVK